MVKYLGDPGGVLVVDETGDVTKGTATVGTQRQYTGTAGRVENAQVAVYLTYAGERGHAMIDRELYLPESWVSRFFAGFLPHGASDDGGRDEFDESPASRRSNSAIRSPCAAITRAYSALRSDNSCTNATNCA